MPGKTVSEKVEELQEKATTLNVQFNNITATLNDFETRLRELKDQITELHRNFEGDIKLLKHQTDEIRKSNDRTGQRLWMIIAPLVSGVFGAGLIYFLGIKK